ncbi:MAG: hypothetical protein QOF59_2032, partial [Actinomycetota bacterium]|nr:hypothetical protein [Actinomycetota bacterium]
IFDGCKVPANARSEKHALDPF